MRERQEKTMKLWGLWECNRNYMKEMFQKVPKGRRNSKEAFY